MSTSEKKHGFTQMPNSFIFGHPELERHDLTVLLALAALSQGKEDFFKVPLRELAQYARVSAGLLCDSISKEKRTEDTSYREGILTKLQGLHMIEYFQKKPPKGQVQTYVRVCWSVLWKDNQVYYEDQKQEKSVYWVNTSNSESVYGVNGTVYQVNGSVYPVNANSESVYPVNESVYDTRSIATPNIEDRLPKDNRDEKDRDTEPMKTQKETSILSPNQQIFFEEIYCQSKIGRIIPDHIDKTLQKHLIKLIQHIKTVRELDSLYEYVQKRLMETNLQDKTVYPGNLTNAKYLSGWLQEKERSRKEMGVYERAVRQSAGELPMTEEEKQQMLQAYASQPTINGMTNFAASGVRHIRRANNNTQTAQEAYESFHEDGLIYGKLPEYWTEERIEQVDTNKQISIRLLLDEWKKGQQLITTGPLAGQPKYDADPWL